MPGDHIYGDNVVAFADKVTHWQQCELLLPASSILTVYCYLSLCHGKFDWAAVAISILIDLMTPTYWTSCPGFFWRIKKKRLEPEPPDEYGDAGDDNDGDDAGDDDEH